MSSNTPSLPAVPNALARTSTDQDGNTPLHAAARNGHEEIVKLLIDAGSLVDAPNRYKETPLHWACYSDHPGTESIINQLLAAGAPVGVTAKNGWSPLHKAAYWGHARVVRQLLESGADRGAKTNSGETALELAHKQQRQAAAEVLSSGETGGRRQRETEATRGQARLLHLQAELEATRDELRVTQAVLQDTRASLEGAQKDGLELRSLLSELKDVRLHLEAAQKVSAQLEQELSHTRIELQQLQTWVSAVSTSSSSTVSIASTSSESIPSESTPSS